MKAKEYVELYRQRLAEVNDERRAVSDMFVAMAAEAGDVQKARGIKTTAGLLGVVREFDQKWRAIASRLDFNPDGYLLWVMVNIPEVYDALAAERAQFNAARVAR
jgi:hypothetical protein